jgi:antirestriction protein ArdC
MPSVYEVITTRIVDKLEAGTVPSHKPWNVETGAPRNLVSGKPVPSAVPKGEGAQ